jgi:hypothetical protein
MAELCKIFISTTATFLFLQNCRTNQRILCATFSVMTATECMGDFVRCKLQFKRVILPTCRFLMWTA